MSSSRSRILVVFGVGVLLGVSHPSAPAIQEAAPRPLAPWPTASWPTCAPEAKGIDSERLADAVQFTIDNDTRLHSLLLVRNGWLVLDAYFHPFSAGSLHDIASVTKSLTATVVGVALRRGDIEEVGENMVDYFADRQIAHMDTDKEAITIEDLLRMRSGLSCVTEPTEVTLFEMMNQPDWVQFILDQPMADAPGSRFVYNSGAVHVLSAVVTEATGQCAHDYACEHLFKPLGIEELIWPKGPQGHSTGWGCVRMKPHDVAKIGYLYLKGGVWEGERILPEGWVAQATQLTRSTTYGYLWWLHPHGVYAASGRGGQGIIVIPSSNIIIVYTAGGARRVNDVINLHLLRAVVSEQPLPANPAGVARLDAVVRRAAEAPPAVAQSPTPLPGTAPRISGRVIRCEANLFRIQSLTLTFEHPGEGVLHLDMGLDTDRAPEYRIGLDGVRRIAPGRFNLPAAGIGSWTSDSTFVAEIDEVGNINQFRFTMTFEEDRVTTRLEEFTGLGGFTIRGRLE
ncbi:MAG: serine hydrolase [Planctomycetota bacterium]